MPFHRPLEALGEEIHLDSGDYHGLLDKLAGARRVGTSSTPSSRRAAPTARWSAPGLRCSSRRAGLGPADGVRIQVDTSGAVEVITGGASIGQGFETVMAQVCAEMLGVDYQQRARHPRPDRPHRARHRRACLARHRDDGVGDARRRRLKVRDKALDMAAELMQAPADALDIVDGEVVRKDGRCGPSITLGEIADDLAPTSKTRGDREPGLSAEGWFYAEHQVYPYGIHLAVVKVDPDTGGVQVERYVIAYDIGRAINPALVKGQIAGGFAQGLGGALLEEFTYNERGDPLATTFADYLLPTVRETPDVEIILTRGLRQPAQSARHQGRGRERHHRRRRRDRLGHRRRHRHSGRGHAAAGDAAAAEGDFERQR